METKIQKTLKQWFPELFAGASESSMQSDYECLQYFARYTIKLIEEHQENEKGPFRIVNMLYQHGSLHDRNAIENEFFCTLSKAESPGSLKLHLSLMPENLQAVYVKTILEN